MWCAILVFLLINTGCSTTTTRDNASKPVPPSTPSSIHLSLGNPSSATTSDPNNYLMIKPQYALSYSRDKGIPNWVSWQLNRSWLGNTDRANDFRPDPQLPDGWYRVTGSEYKGTGLDRGHMAPSSDRTRNKQDNSATFLMTNILPQSPNNNRDYWRELEEKSRDLVEQGNELYIVAGGYGETTKIGNGKVSVPKRLYKIVVITNPKTGVAGIDGATKIIAIDTPNSQGKGDWEDFITTVDDIEKKTGYDFLSNIDKSVQNVIEAKRYSLIGNKTAKKSNKNCSPAYPDVCIPPPPPDLNCKDIEFRKFKVLPPDPHNFDSRDKDGVGCES